MAKQKRKDPLDEPDDLLAPEGVDEGPVEPEPEASEWAEDELGDTPVEDSPEPEGAGSILDEEDDLFSEEASMDALSLADEPLASDLDDLESELEEEDLFAESEEESVEDAPTAWEEELEEERQGGLTDEEWSDLEDEGQALAPGRVVVGYKEFVSLPDQGLIDLPCVCDTGEAESLLFALVEPLEPGRVRLTMGDQVFETEGGEEDGRLVVRTRLTLGQAHRRVAFRVVGEEREVPLVLGRDALEGYFVVDVALGYIHRRQKPPQQ